MRAAIVERAIQPATLLAEVASAAHGASALFAGTVRDMNDGRAVTGIEYSSYAGMAEKEMQRILDEAAARFGVTAIVMEHRVGAFALAEVSVAIAAAHAHREPALDALRYCIEQIKQRVPVWKRELYADGTREWIDPTAARATAGVAAGVPPTRTPSAGSSSHA